MATNNAINIKDAGVVTNDGAGTFSGNSVTEGAILLGSSSNTITDTGVLAKGVLVVGDGATAPTLLSVGANDEVLVADSALASGIKWAGVAQGLTYISKATASSSASVSFTDLTSAFFMYVVDIDALVPATDGADLYMRTSANNGSSYDSAASDYAWTRLGTTPTNDTADAQIILAASIGTKAVEELGGAINLLNPSSSNYTVSVGNIFHMNAAGSPVLYMSCGERVSAAGVDAIQFLMSSGNIASGTFRLYGIKSS